MRTMVRENDSETGPDSGSEMRRRELLGSIGGAVSAAAIGVSGSGAASADVTTKRSGEPGGEADQKLVDAFKKVVLADEYGVEAASALADADLETTTPEDIDVYGVFQGVEASLENLQTVSTGCDDSGSWSSYSVNGCSYVPDQICTEHIPSEYQQYYKGGPTCEEVTSFNSCCDSHDRCYGVGGTELNRRMCDEALRNCMIDAGAPTWVADSYYEGVRTVGGGFFNYCDDGW